MSKKNLNPAALVNELKGGSSFFPARQQEPNNHKEAIPPIRPAQPKPKPKSDRPTPDTVIPRNHDTMTPSNHGIMTPPLEDELLETVRKAVKQIGKEAATQRLTLDEKQGLVDIEYSYKRQGIKTSGNEIMRIATNYIIKDFRHNGENSILAKVLRKLNS